MGTKRPHASTHPSRQTQVPVEPSNKKRKTNPHPNRTLHSSSAAVNPLKSRIRSLTRLLEHDDDEDENENNKVKKYDANGKKVKSKSMPADIRIARERELQALKSQLEDAERERRKKEIIGRFHMVRFFDRRKAERRVKTMKRKLKELKEGQGGDDEEAADDGAQMKRREEELRDAEVDLNYTQYYPLDVAYSSLWPTRERKQKPKGKQQDAAEDAVMDDANEAATDAAASNDAPKGDREMWNLVAKCMAEGKLDALRNGKIYKLKPTSEAAAVSGAANGVAAKRDKNKNKKKQAKGKGAEKVSKATASKNTIADEDEDESDGGFFE